MASSTPQPERTIEFYLKLADRDLELIESQRAEIGKLKAKVNSLLQKLDSKRNTSIHTF